LIVEYLVCDVYAKKEKYITNLIKDLIAKEGFFITTEGYKKVSGGYTAEIILIFKVRQ